MMEHAPEPRPLRVMHVVHMVALAGMEYGVIKLVNGLDRERFAPSIACFFGRQSSSTGLLDDRIPVHDLRKKQGRDFSVIFRLARLCRREGVDLVHSHNWQTFFYTVLAARLARVPVIIHGEHGREAKDPPLRQLLLKRYLARSCARITAVSSDLALEIVDQWRVLPEKVLQVRNGVDLDRFATPRDPAATRRELGIPPDAAVVMTVGGLRPVKDHPTLIRAFAKASASFPEARLVIVGGDWPVPARPHLEDLARSLGIADRVVFAGVRQDVPDLLAAGDVYVNSSVFEGMSNTILEAMASSRPVIATAVGGNPELVHDGETGFLVPPGDVPAMAERLTRLFAEPGLCAALGQGGRRVVERLHPLSGMVQRYADLYLETWTRSAMGRRATARERAKQAVARTIRSTGLARVKRSLDRGHLAILTYHRVLPLPDALDYPFTAMTMPRDHFEAQMGHLARHYQVLPLGDAVTQLRKGTLPARTVAITFDDGYRDNHDHALPILRKYSIPATIFVVSDSVLGRTTLWWDEIARIAGRLARQPAAPLDGERLDDALAETLGLLRRGAAAPAVAEQIVARMNRLSRADRGRNLGVLRALAGPDPAEAGDLMMSLADLQELRNSGVEIGAHTVTHAFLDELDESQVSWEIEESVRSLNEALGMQVRFFAYPRGRASEPVKRLLVRAGIEAAFTTDLGVNDAATDPMAYGRLDSGYLRLRGDFDPAVFDAEIQRWFVQFR